MRVIFITISEGSIARNILRSSFLESIFSEKDIRVFLLVPKEKEAVYAEEFGSDRVSVLPISEKRNTFFNSLAWFLARNGIFTETVFTDQRTYSKKAYAFFLKRAWTFLFGRSEFYHSLVRLFASFRKPSPEIMTYFEKYKPLLVFATDVQDEIDLDVMASARRFGTRIVGMVRSWDNLTSSAGLVQIVPDILLVWNPYLHKKAVEIQHIPAQKIKVIGIPQFDWYVKKEIFISRENFAAKFGFSSSHRILLFAGIGNFLAPHEIEVLEILSSAIDAGELPRDLKILFRPHPNFSTDRESVAKLSHVAFDDSVATYTDSRKASWEMDREKIIHLANSLYHADLVITTSSTMTIDAVAFGKPVICIAFDGKSREPYWNSVERYYKGYTHYIDLSKTGGFRIAYSLEDLIKYVKKYIANPRFDEEGRRKIFEDYIWKLDGKSAERIAALLIENI